MEINLNLASKPYLNRQNVRLWLLTAGLFMLLLLVLNCVYAFQNYRQLQSIDNRFQELEGQVSGLQGAPAGYTPEKHAVLVREVALANQIVNADQFRWTVLLDRFEELVPGDVSIRTIQPDFAKRSLQLGCVARDVSAMTRFVDNLLTSEDFSQAYLQRHGEVVVDTASGRQAQIVFSLEIREAF